MAMACCAAIGTVLRDSTDDDDGPAGMLVVFGAVEIENGDDTASGLRATVTGDGGTGVVVEATMRDTCTGDERLPAVGEPLFPLPPLVVPVTGDGAELGDGVSAVGRSPLNKSRREAKRAFEMPGERRRDGAGGLPGRRASAR